MFAIVVTCFVRLWGTADYESLSKFERAYGSRYAGLALGNMATRSGLGAVGGIPVYDITQGFGYRLPTQGALGQSPLVWLRFVASAELIQALSFLPALFLVSWAVTSLLGPRGLGRSTWRITVAHVVLLGPIFLYSVVNEWTPTAVGFCARVTVIAAALRLAVNTGRPWRIREATQWSLVVVAAFGLIATGHPGEWPLVLPAAIMLTIQAYRQLIRAPHAWPRCAEVLRTTAVLAVGVAAVLAISAFEIVEELGQPSTGSIRVAQGLAFTSDKLPGIVGAVGGENRAIVVVLLVMSVLGPVVDLVMPTHGRYEFVGLTVLVVLAIHLRRRASDSQHLLARWAFGLIVVTTLWWLGEVTSLIPSVARSSGAWLHAAQVLMCGVLAVLGLWNCKSSARVRRGTALFGDFMASGALMVAMLYPFSMLAGSPPSHRNWQENMAAVSRLLPAGVRAEVAGSLLDDERNLVTPSWVRSRDGFPTLEDIPKIRNAATLSIAPALDQSVSPKVLLQMNFSDVRDFASIAVVVGSKGDGQGPVSPAMGEVMDRVTLPNGEEGVALRRTRFHTFTVEESQLVSGDTRCPLLDDPACLSKVAPSRTDPRNEARWRLGKGGVLATYEWDVSRATWAVLVPLDFDPALVVTDLESSDVLRTHSHYGLLAVELPTGASSGVMQFTLRPDTRMYARVLATYLHSIGLVISVVSMYRRRRTGADLRTRD
jgi:hypothetical protein